LRRAGCVERRTSGSGSGQGKPTGGNTGRASLADFHHNFLHLPIGIDDALAEARGLHTSFALAHQYLGQLSREMAEAIDANARNKVFFALAPKDAVDQVHHVKPWLDDGDLMRLGGYEVVLRPVSRGRAVRPVTADTIAPPEPHPGRAEVLRRAARRRTGLDQKKRRALLGDAATTTAAAQSSTGELTGEQQQPAPLIGANTFPTNDAAAAKNSSGSNEESNAPSNERSHGDEHAGQRSPPHAAPAQLNHGEEDR
jgi:hypothetical protein